MKARVLCKSCDDKVLIESFEADDWPKMADALAVQMLACHQTPHTKCVLSYEITEGKEEAEEATHGEPHFLLRLSCLSPQCKKKDDVFSTLVPYRLTGLMGIVFHSSHEGHRFKVEYDGREWESP